MLRGPRRNGKNEIIRQLTTETRISTEHLVYQLFVSDGTGISQELSSLPGNSIWSQDKRYEEIESCLNLGLRSFILFPKVVDNKKDPNGTYGYDTDNFYLRICRGIKSRFPEIVLISDIALDPYSSDGHDGIVNQGRILNDETLVNLAKMALCQADAGCDILGPSDMMDGRIGFIRQQSDENGFTETSIMSYTAKYASAFYGPFRDALESAPVEKQDVPKDKKCYQMILQTNGKP